MEIWAIVAVGFFTLIGAIVGSVLTHVLQQKAGQKQRKWMLEDETRKLKRELWAQRLENVDEIVELMVKVICDTKDDLAGIQAGKDVAAIEKAKSRIGEISSDAYTSVLRTGSEDLMKNYRLIVTLYWDLTKDGKLTEKQAGWGKTWDEIKEAQIAVGEILDNLRISGKENDAQD